MKMVKSLLLGSAAGLVAVTAGQAADLPVKAQPVQYVKVCSLYGAGFYYMPGTDMCLKMGGFARAEITYGANGSLTWGPFANNAQNRTTSNMAERARAYITADVREQTSYGTARGYIAVGVDTNDTGLANGAGSAGALQANMHFAYVQFGGFTAGLAQSFYDFYNVVDVQYRGGYLPASYTGWGNNGWWVWAYTAQLGGGFSASLSAEERRTTQIIDANCVNVPSQGAFPAACGSIQPGGYPASGTYTNPTGPTSGVGLAGGQGMFPNNGAYGGEQVPDIVANLRLDQAWGGAQIMGAVHEVNASYYGSTSSNAPTIASLAHPNDAWGWAVGAGLKVNAPANCCGVSSGDYFQTQVNYAQGALRYLFNTQNTNWGITSGGGALEDYGVLSDCVFGGSPVTANTTGCQLTTAWGFNASYEHYWTPQWHESIFGAYYAVSYNSLANAMLCSAAGSGATGQGSGAALSAGSLCNNNWSMWGVGSRLQYDVTKSFYIGVEALYENMTSATPGGGTGTAIRGYAPDGATGTSATTLQQANTSAWAVSMRIHKDFLP